MRAEIVAQDFEVGLALLRVKRQGLPAAPIADSRVARARHAGVRDRLDRAARAPGGGRARDPPGRVRGLLGVPARARHRVERGQPGLRGRPALHPDRARWSASSRSTSTRSRAPRSRSRPSATARNQEEFMRFGRVVSRPQRAWLGVFAHALEEGVVVAGLVPNGPGRALRHPGGRPHRVARRAGGAHPQGAATCRSGGTRRARR